MMSARCTTAVRVLLLVALVWVATVEQSVASLAILWRVSVLSWDNPATQLRDETAAQAVAGTDVRRQARDHLIGVLQLSHRVAPPEWPLAGDRPAFDFRLTRAPPA